MSSTSVSGYLSYDVEDRSGRTVEMVAERPRALVVDDVADIAEMIAIFLDQAGYDVVTAMSAPEALRVAHARAFDVVVSDIGMPRMNGYELAEALRSMPDYRTVPMIAVTGFSRYDDCDRALQSGFNAHLTKPINPAVLLSLIEGLRD
jgi:two-component system, chemotaxis family, CheB/CheR fusion protein